MEPFLVETGTDAQHIACKALARLRDRRACRQRTTMWDNLSSAGVNKPGNFIPIDWRS